MYYYSIFHEDIDKEINLSNCKNNLIDIVFGLGLPPILKVFQQYRVIMKNIGECRIDIFVVHENYTTSIFEVKNTNHLKYPSQTISVQ